MWRRLCLICCETDAARIYADWPGLGGLLVIVIRNHLYVSIGKLKSDVADDGVRM